MYLWALHSGDTAEPPRVRGITDDLDRVMRLTEPYLIEGRCFLCCVVEVQHVMTVIGMDTSYAPTGRGWIGRRNTRGGVAWRETEIPVDPPTAPSAHASGWDACDFGSSQNPSKAPATPPSDEWPPPRKPSASTRSSVPTT
jgi:hypothetical protein